MKDSAIRNPQSAIRKSVLWSGLLLGLLAYGCQTAVLHGLSEQEANQVIAILQQQGIIATKQIDNPEANTWKVTVPRRDAVKVWGVLQEYRLPSPPVRRFKDVFGKGKLVVTPMEEKALFLEALQGEIAHTLESVAGIISARVHVVIPEPDITGQVQGEAKASVMMEYRPDPAGQAPLRPDEAQRLVANAVQGLKPENVAVVMKPIQMAPPQQTYDMVSFGPIVVARPSLATLKIATVIIVLSLLFMGGLLFWQGRVLAQLRGELAAAQRQLRAIQKPPKQAA